jgi:hypothetical protein
VSVRVRPPAGRFAWLKPAMLRRLAAFLFILPLLAGCHTTQGRTPGRTPGRAAGAPSEPYLFVQYPLSKIRPNESPPAKLEATLRLAGREHETLAFGVVNSTSEQIELTGVELSFTGNPDLQARLYRQEYVPITRPSMFFSRRKGIGLWPDPLVPLSLEPLALDRPWDLKLPQPAIVPAGQNRAFVLELYLPAGGARSMAHGRIRCRLAGGSLPAVETTVLPYPFDLPASSSLRTAVGFQFGGVAQKHSQLSSVPFDARELYAKYLKLLAGFRLCPYDPQFEPLKAQKTPGGISIDWGDFDREVGAYLDGTLEAELPPATSIRFAPAQTGLSKPELPDYWRAVAEHFRQRGWLAKAFYYLPDEPLRRQYPDVRQAAKRIKSIVPELKTLLTKQFTPALAGSVDIWCPDIPFIGDSITFLPVAGQGTRLYLDCHLNFEPSIYRKRRALGEEVWFYTAMSASFGPYPNLFIDRPAAGQRILAWLAARYGFQGFLYWETTYQYRVDWNPWQNNRTPFPNGEGNLLYPGTPELTGLAEHVPVPSLRLLLLREGFEDYEYLRLRYGDDGNMERRSRALVLSSISWQKDMEKIQEARDALGAEIERMGR